MSAEAATRIGVVAGLVAEAACLSRAIAKLPPARRPILFCSGGDASRAAAGLKRMVGEGIAGLLSLGLAGGLDPGLCTGTLVLADAIVAPDGARYPTDAAWRERVGSETAGAGNFVVAPLLGRDTPVTAVASKRALFASSGAVAVDMESHLAAAAAQAARLPFLALRAIADPASCAVPRAALAGLGRDGRMRPFPVLGMLVLRPWELPALLRLASDAAAALAALRRVAQADALLRGP